MLFIIIDNNAINAINQVMAQATQAGTIVEKDGSDESMLLRLQGPQSVELWVTAELLTQNNPSPVSNAPKENPTPVEYEPTHLEVVLPKKTETHDEHHPAIPVEETDIDERLADNENENENENEEESLCFEQIQVGNVYYLKTADGLQQVFENEDSIWSQEVSGNTTEDTEVTPNSPNNPV